MEKHYEGKWTTFDKVYKESEEYHWNECDLIFLDYTGNECGHLFEYQECVFLTKKVGENLVAEFQGLTYKEEENLEQE